MSTLRCTGERELLLSVNYASPITSAFENIDIWDVNQLSAAYFHDPTDEIPEKDLYRCIQIRAEEFYGYLVRVRS